MTLEEQIANEETSLDNFLKSDSCDEIGRAFIKQRPVDWLFALIQQENTLLSMARNNIEELEAKFAGLMEVNQDLMDRIKKLEIKTNH